MRSLQMRIKVADKFALPRRYRYVKCKGSWYLASDVDGMEMWPCEVEMKEWESQLMAVWNLLLALQWRIQGGPGGLDPTPLVFRPNWGPKGRNIFFLRLVLPPFLRVWMTAKPPTSLSEDPPLRYWCLFLKSTVFRWESFCCHGRATVESIWTKLPSKTEVSIEGEKRLFFVKWFKC